MDATSRALFATRETRIRRIDSASSQWQKQRQKPPINKV